MEGGVEGCDKWRIRSDTGRCEEGLRRNTGVTGRVKTRYISVQRYTERASVCIYSDVSQVLSICIRLISQRNTIN